MIFGFSTMTKEFQAEDRPAKVRSPPRRDDIDARQRTGTRWEVSKFPHDILFLIFDQLDPATVLWAIPLVCKCFNSICLDLDSSTTASHTVPTVATGSARVDTPKTKDKSTRTKYLRVHRNVRKFIDRTIVPKELSIDLFVLDLCSKPPTDQIYAINVKPAPPAKPGPPREKAHANFISRHRSHHLKPIKSPAITGNDNDQNNIGIENREKGSDHGQSLSNFSGSETDHKVDLRFDSVPCHGLHRETSFIENFPEYQGPHAA